MIASAPEAFEALMRLAKERLVHVRFSDDRSLALFKYHRRVFDGAKWAAHPTLTTAGARGGVFDTSTGELVVYPLDKLFNWQQQPGQDLDLSTKVRAVRKVNGFMAAAALHKGRMVVSTTGGLDTVCVSAAKKALMERSPHLQGEMVEGYTYIFEVVDGSVFEPVVPERPGVFLVGQRANCWGSAMAHEETLDEISRNVAWIERGDHCFIFDRPSRFETTFGELLSLRPEIRHEGWVVQVNHRPVLKLKTPYYEMLKILAARSILYPGVERSRVKAKVDAQFHPLVDFVLDDYGGERFKSLERVERLRVLQDNARTA